MSKYHGMLAATGAFALWGILPVYWKLLQAVPSTEILCHRMVWSLFVTVGLVFFYGRKSFLLAALRDRRTLVFFSVAAMLLAVNWLLYIWAVNSGYIVEASLGYFINPLISVLFGMIFFRERMRVVQWLALLLAALGVVYLTLYYGRFPWIAITLAVSFAIYGLLHKKTSVAALDGLCLETAVVFFPALLFLMWAEAGAGGAFGHMGLGGSLLLAGSGLVTTIPLLLFGYAAQNIPLSSLGLLQYLSPSISLIIGVFVYGEDFSRPRMTGFCLIWLALAIYMVENLARRLRYEKKPL